MTTLLERPTILASGRPPLTHEGDAPSPPSETGSLEAPQDEEED